MPEPQTRSHMTLGPGTKVAFLVAALMVVAALYFYWLPVHLLTDQGAAFGCGSAAQPATDAFPKSICQNTTDINLYRTFALLAGAFLTAVLGYVFFTGTGTGTDTSEQAESKESTILPDDSVRGDTASQPRKSTVVKASPKTLTTAPVAKAPKATRPTEQIDD